MKNYIIGFLAVSLMVLGTFFYKSSKILVLNGFPIDSPQLVQNESGEPPLYLFIFFSRNNCHTCMDSIQVLNELPPKFVVTGIVPANELENETDLRAASGAAFKLTAFNEGYRRFSSHYSPSIYGVSGNGNVLFIMPGVPEQKGYLYNFLVNFYGKSFQLLIPAAHS